MIKQIFVEASTINNYMKVPGHLWHLATHYTHIPSIDPEYPFIDNQSFYGWYDVVYLSNPIIDHSGAVRKPEWIYILVNSSMPGMVKIGMTTTSVTQRVKEINSATGVPTPWISVYQFKCFGSKYLERDIHNHLATFRVAKNREMFSITSTRAQEVIEELGVSYTNMLYLPESID
jgi:hypothetical protein